MKHIQQLRRNFLKAGVMGFFTALLASLPKISFSQPPPVPIIIGNNRGVTDKGVVVHEDEGEHILTGRRKAPITVKISKATHHVDSISFCAEDIIPGRKLRIHKHLNHDELIFIHRGEGLFTLDEQLIEVKSGTVMFVPRGVWHGLENTGKENIRMLFGYSPAGFEGYFIENGTPVGMVAKERTPEQYAMAEKKYGMVYKEI